jgi:hypothetical protein
LRAGLDALTAYAVAGRLIGYIDTREIICAQVDLVISFTANNAEGSTQDKRYNGDKDNSADGYQPFVQYLKHFRVSNG